MTRADPQVDAYVDRLCERGCRAVLGYIEALRAGRDLPEFAGLDPERRRLLCSELEAIMAVYGSRCTL